MRRLQTRIAFHFLGVLLLVGGAWVLHFVVGWRATWLHNILERQVQFVSSLVGDRIDDPPARDALVQRIADDLDVWITLRDLDGNPLTVVGRPLPPLEPDMLRTAGSGPVFVAVGRPRFVAAIVRRDGVPRAVLEATPRRRVAPGMAQPLLLVGLVLFGVGLASVPLARRISRPVEKLTEASRRFGGGDLSYRVPARKRWRRRRRADELEELIRAWNEMAERIERLVRGQKELLANVSHELRSPLARLRVALELLPRDAGNARLVDDIGVDIGELDRLIEDVLTMSRLEATGLPTHVGPVDARALLDGIVDRARVDPATAGRAVTVADGAGVALQADGALLKRALWNLVENAAKYGAPPIALAVEAAGDRVRFSVSDDGPGISGEEREKVFAPFYRGDKAHTPGAGGFGLGLTLARRVAEVHGGAIHVEAARVVDGGERGCRVVLDLPRQPS